MLLFSPFVVYCSQERERKTMNKPTLPIISPEVQAMLDDMLANATRQLEELRERGRKAEAEREQEMRERVKKEVAEKMKNIFTNA